MVTANRTVVVYCLLQYRPTFRCVQRAANLLVYQSALLFW